MRKFDKETYSSFSVPLFRKKTVLMMIKLTASHRNIGVHIINAQPFRIKIDNYYFSNIFFDIFSELKYLPAGVIDVSYLFEESETEPTNMPESEPPAPATALNASIKTKLTEAPTIKHRLKIRPCILTRCSALCRFYSNDDSWKLACLYKHIMSQHDKNFEIPCTLL